MAISESQLLALRSEFGSGRRNELDRILMRAQADLAQIMYALGSGSPSTVKRATALTMALNGVPLAEIAAAVALPEERVGQILGNILAAGNAALYPSFAEEVALPAGTNLWKIIEPMIKSLPPSRGVRTAAWNPGIVLDYLVHDGTLSDASVGQITRVIERNLHANETPATFEYVDTAHQPQGKAPPVFVSLILVLVGMGIIATGVFELSSSGIVAVVIVVFGLVWTAVIGLGVIKQLQERSLLRKILAAKKAKSASALPVTPAPARPQPPAPHEPLPPPPFTIQHALDLPEVSWRTDSITDSANVLGQPPLPVLYLWVFAAQSDQCGYETEGWPQLGPVHLLLNSTALTINKLAEADKLLTGDDAKLEAEVAAYVDRAGSYPRPNLFYTVETSKSVYRGYPIHTLICTDDVWQNAFRKLAARSRIAIVNLSGYNPSHPGLEFEILHLLSGGPPTQFVFLYERTTDADAVITGVLNLWSRLPSPPATTPTLHFLRIPESQDVGYGMQFNKMTFGIGWLGKIHLDREGPYTPIAGRILAFLKQYESAHASPPVS